MAAEAAARVKAEPPALKKNSKKGIFYKDNFNLCLISAKATVTKDTRLHSIAVGMVSFHILSRI